MRLKLAPGWTAELDRGPDCLFIRLHGQERTQPAELDLADQLSRLLDQEFAHRLVVEMDDVPAMRSHMLAELVRLCQQIHDRGGMMRVCGLSADNHEILQRTRLSELLPLYRSRTEAVMGCDRPLQHR